MLSLEYESDTDTLAITVSTDFVKLKPVLLVVDVAYVGNCGNALEDRGNATSFDIC